MALMGKPKGNGSASILVPAPTVPADDQIQTLQVSNPTVELTSVNTTFVDKGDLLTHIEGGSWVVDYYSQVLTKDSDLSGQQESVSATYQSYRKIKSMEMKVTSALSTSQVDENKSMTVEGTSMLYPFIVPNEGDMFVADLGQGKQGVFRVTNTVKKSIYAQSCYEISYGIKNDSLVTIADLEEKSVEILYFRKDFLQYGSNPLIGQTEFNALVELETTFAQLFRVYCMKFYSKEFATILMPSQQYSIYDHYLCRFMFEMFGNGPRNELLKMKMLSSFGDDLLGYPSIWQAISELDTSLLTHGFSSAGLIPSSAFELNPMLDSIRYSGFNYIVYPKDPHIFVDYQLYSNRIKTLDIETIAPSPITGVDALSLPEAALTQAALDTNGFIYPVASDDKYVLSSHFYAKDTNMSTLEKLLWDYLDGNKIDAVQLLAGVKASHQWKDLEQYYYWPIILTLIQATLLGR